MEFLKGSRSGSLTFEDDDFKQLLSTINDPDGDLDAAQFNFGSDIAPAYVTKGEKGLTAVPPPSSLSMSFGRPRSNSGTIMSRRLRSASDMHHQGYITSEEKATLKTLILSRDPRFREEFSTVEKSGDWGKLRDMLRSGKFSHIRPQRHSIVDALDDFADVNLADLPEDLSSVFDSAYSELERTRGRKRAASRTAPVQRVHKKLSSPSSKKAPMSSSTSNARSAPKIEKKTTAASSNSSSASSATLDATARLAKVKQRKNERERRRRLAVSRGFEELFKLLKLPQTARIDKATILQNAISRINALEKRVVDLERKNGLV